MGGGGGRGSQDVSKYTICHQIKIYYKIPLLWWNLVAYFLTKLSLLSLVNPTDLIQATDDIPFLLLGCQKWFELTKKGAIQTINVSKLWKNS